MESGCCKQLLYIQKKLAWINAGKPADLSVTDQDFEEKLARIIASTASEQQTVKAMPNVADAPKTDPRVPALKGDRRA